MSTPKDNPERDPTWCISHGKTRKQEEDEQKKEDQK